MRRFSKSPLQTAKEALAVGKGALPDYASKFSRKDFTQPQLFAILVLKQFFHTDDRGILQYLKDFKVLQNALKLKKLPHHTTLFHAQQRFLKKTELRPYLEPAYDERDSIWGF